MNSGSVQRFCIGIPLLGAILLLQGCAAPRPVAPEAPMVPVSLRSSERETPMRLTGLVVKGAPASITVDDLERLPQTEYSVFDPYTKRQTTYRGVLVREFVRRYGSHDTATLRLRAVDDFKAVLTSQEWNRWDVLLATRTEGARMTIATNGPARIVFPYDTHPEISRTLYNDKWIWQINRFEFQK